jgi:hypothetical protein
MATLVVLAVMSVTGRDVTQDSPVSTGESRTDQAIATNESSPTPATRPRCNPVFGFPRNRQGCSDPSAKTGWLTQTKAGGLLLEPFRTLGNDAQGNAYAQKHGLEFPFPNDYHDASTGAPRPLTLSVDTACTGIISVGYREPLKDHPVACSEFPSALKVHGRIHVVVWRRHGDGDVLQMSELYRP